MKPRITLLLCAGLLGLATLTVTDAHGQSGTSGAQPSGLSPTTMSTNYVPPGFLGQGYLFLTQTDRGLGTWTTTNGAPKTFDVYIGACFENNINADGIIGGDYRVYKYVVVDGYARIFNSNQTLKSLGFGPGIEIPIGDLKVGVYGDIVYRIDDHCLAVSPKLGLKNGVGKNAFLLASLATDYEIKSHAAQRPYLTTAFGFNF